MSPKNQIKVYGAVTMRNDKVGQCRYVHIGRAPSTLVTKGNVTLVKKNSIFLDKADKNVNTVFPSFVNG